VANSEEALKLVEQYLAPILEMRERIANSCEELGYIVNSFGSIVRPQKSWAIFNNFMQALAADILVDKLFQLKTLLENYKTKFLFQVHDSFMFDFHPDEMFLIDEIKNVLSQFNNITLNVEHSIGSSWQDCNKPELVQV
jgi:DNA polymerase I-like protein with 3'-5' exonuclease and polymerase domains